MRIALIPCGATEWRAAGRLLGRVELPLTEEGESECKRWGQTLAGGSLKRLLHASDELCARTAAIVAAECDVPIKISDDLVEVDFGLWTGLTEAQLKGRYPSAYEELGEAPLNVVPPNGEALQAAAERIGAVVDKLRTRNGQGTAGLILRPAAFALALGLLSGGGPDDLLAAMRAAVEPVIMPPETGEAR